ncbi:MAG: tetratricopeptide repeat protein [Bacteroidales bacterium]|nr:tetratricopeptide repeat protein [Bacteroidales bacterium]
MKRIFISLILISCVMMARAQDPAVPTLNYNQLEKKLVKSDAKIQDPKQNTKSKTWFSRGELFQDINDVNIEFLRYGMPAMEIKLYYNEPTEIRTREEGGVVTEEFVYERIVLTLENGTLIGWKETKVLHEDPLPEALSAYKKALEYDTEGKLDEKVLENLNRLKRQCESKAIIAFTAQDFNKSVEYFELIMDATSTRVYGGVADTVIIYNTALAAKNGDDHKKAAEYFRKAIDLNYGGSDAYYLLKNEYIILEDSAAAIAVLEEGFERYPDTSLILIEIVNYYLTAGDAEKGLAYLELAEQKETRNPSIYFAKGTLFEKVGEDEKALLAYQQALDIDPEYFNAYFNIGALYYNNAVELYDVANSKEDLKEYNAAKSIADKELTMTVAPMEKAHELRPDDRAVLETLQTVYYRLQMMDKYEEIKVKISELNK